MAKKVTTRKKTSKKPSMRELAPRTAKSRMVTGGMRKRYISM
jgi:hypothetical protein